MRRFAATPGGAASPLPDSSLHGQRGVAPPIFLLSSHADGVRLKFCGALQKPYAYLGMFVYLDLHERGSKGYQKAENRQEAEEIAGPKSNFTTICALGFASRRSVKGVLRVTCPSIQGLRDPKH